MATPTFLLPSGTLISMFGVKDASIKEFLNLIGWVGDYCPYIGNELIKQTCIVGIVFDSYQ